MQQLNRYYKIYIYLVFNFLKNENIYFLNYFSLSLILTSDVYGGPTDIVTGMPREDANTCLTTRGCELLVIFMFLIGLGPFRKLI